MDVGVTYWYTRWRRILRFAFGIVTEPYLPAKRHAELIREARLHLAGYAMIVGVSLMAHSGAAVYLWLAPMLVMKWVHQLQNTMEHLGLPHEDNVLVNTRSTRTNASCAGWGGRCNITPRTMRFQECRFTGCANSMRRYSRSAARNLRR
jgi:hypothetical protein